MPTHMPLDLRPDQPSDQPTTRSEVVPVVSAKLPAVVPPNHQRARRRKFRRWLFVAALLAAAAGGFGTWWLRLAPTLPPGIAWGNGRLESDEIDIDTKFAGRIAKLFVDEGDMVAAGQVLAMMDTQDLEASLRKAEALVSQAERTLEAARANVDQQKAQVVFAKQELERMRFLVPKGFAPKELLDQRQQQVDGGLAALAAATETMKGAEHALDAATHDVELYQVNIADNTLVAPRLGRIQYRVANVGEVLPAGGKVFTMLDVGYVYMDIYLPTVDVGKIKIGSDARIVLDAYPDRPIPAKVSFIATQAQFTPKMVETRTERDKLVFRVRVRIDPDLLRRHAEAVRSGLPGLAYVRTDPAVAWPDRLQWTGNQ